MPPTEQEGFLLSTASPAFICRFSDDGHSDWCEVVPDCSFDLYFSKNYQCWTSFHVPLDLYVFFGERSVEIFCPFRLQDCGFLESSVCSLNDETGLGGSASCLESQGWCLLIGGWN